MPCSKGVVNITCPSRDSIRIVKHTFDGSKIGIISEQTNFSSLFSKIYRVFLRAQQTDASFCQFETLEYGWRAAFYLLTRTYYHKYRLFTIRAIISKWAPPQENLTSTYIENVCRLAKIPPDEPIGIPSDQPERWMAVGVAMAIQENGTESLDHFAMLRGWGLARQVK